MKIGYIGNIFNWFQFIVCENENLFLENLENIVDDKWNDLYLIDVTR